YAYIARVFAPRNDGKRVGVSIVKVPPGERKGGFVEPNRVHPWPLDGDHALAVLGPAVEIRDGLVLSQGEEAKGRATGLAHAVADVVGAVMDLRIRGCAVGEVGVAVEVPVEIANEGKRGDGRQALMSKEFHDDLALAQGREASVAAVAARRHFQPALLLSGFQRQANLQGSQRKRFV